MLSTLQKAKILDKVGYPIPTRPIEGDLDTAMLTWRHAVETIYVSYAAARAAKSLRDAEELRQMDMLRRMSLRSYA